MTLPSESDPRELTNREIAAELSALKQGMAVLRERAQSLIGELRSRQVGEQRAEASEALAGIVRRLSPPKQAIRRRM